MEIPYNTVNHRQQITIQIVQLHAVLSLLWFCIDPADI